MASSADALLSQCISEVDEELLVLDFSQFKYTTDQNNEMDLHLEVANSGMDDLLVHPIMKAFLEFKWRLFNRMFWLNMLLDLLFAISVTSAGWYFINLTHCHELCDDDWSDQEIFCSKANDTHWKWNHANLKCERHVLR